MQSPEGVASLPDPRIVPQALADMADAFGSSFTVATVLVALCLVPAALLPRRRPAVPVDGDRADDRACATLDR